MARGYSRSRAYGLRRYRTEGHCNSFFGSEGGNESDSMRKHRVSMDGDLGDRPAAFLGVGEGFGLRERFLARLGEPVLIEFGRWGISIKSAVAGFPFTKA